MNNNSLQFDIIETERLILRSLTPGAYNFIFGSYPDEAIKTFFGFTSTEELIQEKEKYKGGLATFNRSFQQFHLVEKLSGQVIGMCGYHTWYLQHNRAEIGYGLTVESAKNKGYMKEALLPILLYGFECMDLHRIEAMASPGNEPSLRLLRGAGFTEEGMLREHYLKDGHYENSVVLSLLKKEWNLRSRGRKMAEDALLTGLL